MNCKIKTALSGFTLIEVTVATALLMMTFGGLMTLMIVGRESSVSVKNNLIASNLAREGVVLVRAKRDKNYVVSDPAFTAISDLDGTYMFTIDYQNTITEVTSGGVKDTAVLNLLNNYYSYSEDPGATPTVFKRLITTTYHDETPPYLTVESSVFWKQDNKQHTETVVDELTDWH